MDILKLSSTTILSFYMPGQVFSRDMAKAEMEFKQLRSFWHPDKNSDPKAAEVFTRINNLWNKVKVITGGQSKEFDLANDKSTIHVHYQYAYDAGNLGTAYVGVNGVAYHVKPENSDLVNNWVDNQIIFLERLGASVLGPAKEAMKGGFIHPSSVHVLEDTSTLIVQRIPRLYTPLRQLYDHYKGRLPAKQAAWIITRMFTSACLFEICGMVSNSFTLDSMFVFPGPGTHGGFELAAFGYSSILGGKLKFLPSENLDFYPAIGLSAKQAVFSADLVMLKRTGIQLLGDPTGVGTILIGDASIPKLLLEFLMSPTKDTDSALIGDVYRKYHDIVLLDSFGPRKYEESGVTTEDLYLENL